jgi:hypothetical protein
MKDKPSISMQLLHSEKGIPIICSTEDVSADFRNGPFEQIPNVIGNPISFERIGELNNGSSGSRLRLAVMGHVTKSLVDNALFGVAMTSHDQSRTGKSRDDSTGHRDGYCSDFIFIVGEGKNKFPLVDLINSLSFLEYMRVVAESYTQLCKSEINLRNSRNLVIGIEYDHIHIEWPWSTRKIATINSNIRLSPSTGKVMIGSFYHPQLAYGLPKLRLGLKEGVLLVHSS